MSNMKRLLEGYPYFNKLARKTWKGELYPFRKITEEKATMVGDEKKQAKSIKVTVRPQHVLREHSVEIALSTDNPLEMHYHLIEPERALSLLAQLEQERDKLEQMAGMEL